jgi:ribosome-binding protein aMBF1 (putative translation factor)
MKTTRKRKNELPQVVYDVGKRIEAIIKQKGLKKRDVAYEAELEVENLRKYIKGRQEMRIGTLSKIARALKVEVGDLFKKK